MTHRNHSVEQMRTHAKEVARIDFVALPQPERDKLEIEYKAEWDAIADKTSIEANKLKLTIYANVLDPDYNADRINEKDWILENVKATQILINSIIGRKVLQEDGIYGNQTKNCVKDIFGITIPLNQASTTTTPVEGKEYKIPLPDFLKSEKDARAVIAALGIEGLTIKDGHLIGVNEINTQNKLELLERYLDYANYLETGNISPEGLMKRYKELLDYPSNFIEDKKYLIMKYASAIYEEIIKLGHRIAPIDESSGIYEIHKLDGSIVTNSPFQEFINGSTAISGYIEFAKLNYIVGGASSFWKEREVTRQGLVEYILENNSIVSKALKNAGITNDTQKIDSILLNREEVVKQLKLEAQKARGSIGGGKKYEEAMWLVDFLEQEQYKQGEIQKSLFNNVNHYNKVFQAEHSFVDALTAAGINPETVDPKDPNVVDSIQNVLGKATLPVVLLGIFTMLFGGKHKGKGFWLLAGLIGAKVGLGVADATTQEVKKHLDDGKTIGDAFDMFDPIKLKHRIKYDSAGFEREQYDPILAKLYAANDTRIKEGEINNGAAQVLTNNARIALIFKGIMAKDELLSLDFSSGDTDTLVNSIYTGLPDKEINQVDFETRIVSNQEGEKITEADIRVFVELLQGVSADEDSTLHDALYEGTSPLSEEYKDENFTDDSYFNAEINKHLRARWVTNSPTSGGLTVSQAISGRKEISELKKQVGTFLSSGNFDGIFDWSTTFKWNDFHRNPAEQIGNIDTLIANINANSSYSAATKDSFTKANIGILPRLKTYIQGKDTLAEMSVSGGVIESLKNYTVGLDTSTLRAKISKIDTEISKLDPTDTAIWGIDLASDSIFTNLVNSINEKKRELEGTKLQYVTDLTTALETQRDNVLASTKELNRAISRFDSGGKGADDIEKVMPTLTKEHENLETTWNEIKSGGHAAGSPEKEIYDALKPLFEANGSLETLKTDLTAAFQEYFQKNADIISTRITPLSITTPINVTSVATTIADLRIIEGDMSNELGTVKTFMAFIGGTSLGTTEEYYADAQEIFPTIATSNDSNTLMGVAEAARDKQKDIAQKVYDFISTFAPTTISTKAEFDTIHQMRQQEIVGFVKDVLPNHNIDTIFPSKYALAATTYINTIPITRSGLRDLERFEINYITSNNPTSWIDWLASIGKPGNDHLTNEFSDHVGRVGRSILSSNPDFSEDTAGLTNILDFKKSSEYDFIKEKAGATFETDYKARVKGIAEKVISGFTEDMAGLNALVAFKGSSEYGKAFGIISTDLDVAYNAKLESVRNEIKKKLVNGVGDFSNIATTFAGGYSSADPRLILEDYENPSTKTLQDLITLLNLNNTEPRGNFGNFQENERKKFYDEFKRLNILG